MDLLSGYEHEFVPNTARDPGTHHFGGLRNPTLTARLAAWRPTALLIFGYIKGRFTGTHPVRGALQTALVGGLAAAAAFVIAKLIA